MKKLGGKDRTTRAGVPDIQVAIDAVLTTIEGICVTFQATSLETVSVAEKAPSAHSGTPDACSSTRHSDFLFNYAIKEALPCGSPLNFAIVALLQSAFRNGQGSRNPGLEGSRKQ